MLERLFALETFGIKLGLENIRRLCEALDHPERTFTALHVAGTNGKGSVTALVHAALTAAGINAGRYTSPHLVHLRERFMISGAEVDDATLGEVAAAVLDCADRLQRDGILAAPPTFFEATTAIGFEIFKRAQVAAAVIEVGLGGRFDATNVLAPPVGAITSIAMDHQQHLGDTLGQIAFEKAGIIKAGMTVVCGFLPAEAGAVIAQATTERGARLIEAAAGVRIDSAMEEGRARVTFDTPAGRYGPLRLSLRGEHQVGNALVAVRLLEQLREHGLAIPQAAIVHALEQVEWPGRLEQLTVAGGRRVLLDAAHNEEGARALGAYLARWHPDHPTLVVGVMRDKDADGILAALLPATSSVVVTAADTQRAMPANELAARVRAMDGARSVEVFENAADAVDAAIASSPTVCVAGSIFLIGAVREHLGQRDILR